MYKNNQITKIVDTLLQNSSSKCIVVFSIFLFKKILRFIKIIDHPAVVPFLLVVASIDESNLVFEALKKHYNE